MKILNILTSPFVYDGISMSIMNYFNNIDHSNMQIDFVVPSVDENIRTQVEDKKGKIYLISGRKNKPLTYMNKMCSLIKKNNYDIVQVHGSSAMLALEMMAAKKAGCKIRIVHSHNTKSDYKLLDKFLRPIFYKTYTHAFACGEDAGKWLFRNRKFYIINNGMDINKFQYNDTIRNEFRKKYNLEDKIVLGHVGAFNEQKNHEYLVDIFYNLKRLDKKYFLILIGIGHLKKSIEEKVKKLGLEDNVLFVGQSLEVEKWFQVMDIMLLPSRFEGFPNVLVEAQIAGLPCIVSSKVTEKVNLANLVQFVSIDNGVEQWVEKIQNIKIEDREKNKQEILQQIREKGFDIKEDTKKLERIYEELVKESK